MANRLLTPKEMTEWVMSKSKEAYEAYCIKAGKEQTVEERNRFILACFGSVSECPPCLLPEIKGA